MVQSPHTQSWPVPRNSVRRKRQARRHGQRFCSPAAAHRPACQVLFRMSILDGSGTPRLGLSLDESQSAARCFLNYLSGLVHFRTCRSARSYTFLVPEFAVALQAVFKFGDGVMVDSSLRPHGRSSSIVPHSTLDLDARSPQRRSRTSTR